MDYITLTGIAVGLSFDTFAVSLSCGVVQSKIRFREAMRIAFTLALFQGVLPVAGYLLGSTISKFIDRFDHWIAFLLLAFLGVRMIIEGLKTGEEKKIRDLRRLPELITIAIGTSIDAFAVGISFAFLDTNILISGLVIGFVTFMASMIAIRLGKSAGSHLGQRVEIIGGLILAGIGIKILLEHLLAS